MIFVVKQFGGCVGDEYQAVRGVYNTLEAAENRRAELTTRITSSGDFTFYYDDLGDDYEIHEYELNQAYNQEGDPE